MRLPILALLLAGCAAGRPQLEPAVTATEVPATRGTAAAERTAGVEVIAATNAWRGVPADLQAVTPILVTIDNGSEVPLRVRYQEFDLVTPDGVEYSALPPFDVEGVEAERVSVRLDAPPGFMAAPHFSRFYPGFAPWHGPFAYDPFWYDQSYTAMRRVELPTGDMIQKALPEGVLMPGARVTGFLYFQNPPNEAERVTFTYELVNAETGERFGVARIPFTTGQAVAAR